MFTIAQPFESDYRVKGSRFLGLLHPAGSRNDAQSVLNAVKENHLAATHHCCAWRIGPHAPEEFEQDDGEPKGTAGLPMLNALRSFGLINCIMVSVRYFGGTKLGKAGLIEAYGSSAASCIDLADLKKIILIEKYKIDYDYNLQRIIDKLKNDWNLIELNSVYTDHVQLLLGCPLKNLQHFEKALEPSIHLFKTFDREGQGFHVS